MKLAVTGKGGVGKTTVSALLAGALAERGHRVIAIDADPDSNLAACLGYADAESIRPLVELKDLIEERTGVKPGTTGGMFRLNPLVEDIPDKYAVDVGQVKVLVAGAVKKGGAGCYCPENALVRALVSHLLLDDDTTLILDMEAGVEHLSRGTIGAVDRLVVVVEPGRRSLETARRIKTQAADLGLTRIIAVGNKIRSADDQGFLKESLNDIEFAGFVPYHESIRSVDISGKPVGDAGEEIHSAVSKLVQSLAE
jgi:CO dehydrogenase maturation factor